MSTLLKPSRRNLPSLCHKAAKNQMQLLKHVSNQKAAHETREQLVLKALTVTLNSAVSLVSVIPDIYQITRLQGRSPQTGTGQHCYFYVV